MWAGSRCLCFGLDQGPRIFTKLMKVPIAILRRMIIWIEIYLYDILIISQTRGETLIAWVSVIFLLQHLDFLLNLKKISFKANSRSRLLGSGYKFSEYSTVLHKKEIRKGSETMPVFVVEERNHLNRISETNRSWIIYDPSTGSSTAGVSFSFFNNRRSQWPQWSQTNSLIKMQEFRMCIHSRNSNGG